MPSQCDSLDYDLIILDEVDSTNSELERQLKRVEHGDGSCALINRAYEPSPCSTLAVVAYSQTAGRGRLGRSWASLPGGVYLSINLALAPDSQKNAALSLVVALGVHQAIVQILGCAALDAAVKIKWPNDIVCQKAKLAGILLESSSLQETIVGIGINAVRPAQAFETAGYISDYIDAGQLPELSQIAQTVIANVLAVHQQWQDNGYRFDEFAKEFNKYLSILNQQITVSDASGKLITSGIAQGVDSNGFLLVHDGEQTLAIASGDVTLR